MLRDRYTQKVTSSLQSLFTNVCLQINHIFTDIFNVDLIHQLQIANCHPLLLTSINIYCIFNARNFDVFFSVFWDSASFRLNWKISIQNNFNYLRRKRHVIIHNGQRNVKTLYICIVRVVIVCKFNEREIRRNYFENVQKLRQFTETIAVLQHSDHSGKKSAFPISLKTSLHIIR